MMIDLEKMRELISDGIAGDKRWRDTEGEALSALEELISEVERLRGERPAVVAYLRGIFPEWPAGTNGYADEVERGEHRRKEIK